MLSQENAFEIFVCKMTAIFSASMCKIMHTKVIGNAKRISACFISS